MPLKSVFYSGTSLSLGTLGQVLIDLNSESEVIIHKMIYPSVLNRGVLIPGELK